MAEKTKYGKYFIEYDPTRWPKERRPVMVRMEESVMKGSHFYLVHWVMPGFAKPLGEYKYAGHPPHIHKDAELLIHIGTNPDDPMDLGAEVEMYMGPELERHVFNRTCCIYIPPNFIHAPWRPINTIRPWIFIEINQGPSHTEKSYRQILPAETREKIDWSRWPDEGYDTP
ncbi:MAG: hypothetical protein ABR958_00535 [Dehalococcoidales bacterium]|jgi:hypothetical protein